MINIYKETTHFIFFFPKQKNQKLKENGKGPQHQIKGKNVRNYFSFHMNLLYKSPNIKWLNFKIL